MQRGAVRVYARPDPTAAQRHDGFACDAATGVSVVLNEFAADDGIMFPPPAIAINGTLVVYAVDDLTDPDGVDTYVNVVDLSAAEKGKQVNGGSAGPRLLPSTLRVVSVRVDANRDTASISCTSATGDEIGDGPNLEKDFATGPNARCQRPGTEAYVVTTPRAGGVAKLLDKGRLIDPLSVQLRGSTVVWKDGGTRRSATIRAP